MSNTFYTNYIQRPISGQLSLGSLTTCFRARWARTTILLLLLPFQDSNSDFRDQNPTCCRYTKRQYCTYSTGFQPANRHYPRLHDRAFDFAFLLSDSLHLGQFTIIPIYTLVANYDFHVTFPQCTRLCCVRTLYQPSDKFHVHAFVSLSLDQVVVNRFPIGSYVHYTNSRVAPGGFEPPLREPKSRVLPLYYRAI